SHLRMRLAYTPKRSAQRGLVVRVRARGRNTHLVERQLRSARLLLQEIAPHAMDADALVAGGYRREQRDDLHRRVAVERIEREGAVLSSTPAQHHGFARTHAE